MSIDRLRCFFCNYECDYRPWLENDKLHLHFCGRCEAIIRAGYDPAPGRGYTPLFVDKPDAVIFYFGQLVRRLYPRGLPLTPHVFQYTSRINIIRHYAVDETDMLEIALYMLQFPEVHDMIQQFDSWDNIMHLIGVNNYPPFVPILREAMSLDYVSDDWQRTFLTQIQTVFRNVDILFSPAELEDGIQRYLNRTIPRMAWSKRQAEEIYHALEQANRLIDDKYGIYRIREAITREFGDWYKVLYSIGVPVIKRVRGSVVHAQDGHLCFSVMERVIDDLLFQNGIQHEKEVPYPAHPKLNPRRRLRADWRLGDGTYVEYFGLAGDKDYDQKTERKMELSRQLGLVLFPIYTSRDVQTLIAKQAAKRRGVNVQDS